MPIRANHCWQLIIYRYSLPSPSTLWAVTPAINQFMLTPCSIEQNNFAKLIRLATMDFMRFHTKLGACRHERFALFSSDWFTTQGCMVRLRRNRCHDQHA
eukprot:2899049-Pleurochrysis_carterae.AAC.2